MLFSLLTVFFMDFVAQSFRLSAVPSLAAFLQLYCLRKIGENHKHQRNVEHIPLNYFPFLFGHEKTDLCSTRTKLASLFTCLSNKSWDRVCNNIAPIPSYFIPAGNRNCPAALARTPSHDYDVIGKSIE